MGSKVQMAWIPKSRRMAISPKCRWSEVQLTRSLDFQMARCSYRWGLSPKRPYPNGTPACMFSCWGPILHQKRFPASTFDSKITKYMACKHAKSHHLTRLGKRYFLGLTAWCSRIRKIASAIKWLVFFVNFKNILSVTVSLGHAPVHFTSLHHKIKYNSQVHTHCCGRYFTVVDVFIKQILCREGLGKFFFGSTNI